MKLLLWLLCLIVLNACGQKVAETASVSNQAVETTPKLAPSQDVRVQFISSDANGDNSTIFSETADGNLAVTQCSLSTSVCGTRNLVAALGAAHAANMDQLISEAANGTWQAIDPSTLIDCGDGSSALLDTQQHQWLADNGKMLLQEQDGFCGRGFQNGSKYAHAIVLEFHALYNKWLQENKK